MEQNKQLESNVLSFIDKAYEVEGLIRVAKQIYYRMDLIDDRDELNHLSLSFLCLLDKAEEITNSIARMRNTELNE